MIKVGIIGISGYSGFTLLKILLKHKDVRVTYVAAQTTQGPVSEIWPQLADQTDLICEPIDIKKAVTSCELIFLATPHGASLELTPQLLKAGIKVIDLSGDYRLKDKSLYKKWYNLSHNDSKNLAHSVYGLPELNRESIKKAQLIANPGCYPTAASLALAPIVSAHNKAITSIVIDAKSGVSGAGKKLAADLTYNEVNENFKAYKVLQHQHTPEMEQCLSALAASEVKINFVPHLLPATVGIFETIYVQLNEKMDLTKIYSLYKKFYKTEPFVRVLSLGKLPELKYTVGTNFCDIGLSLSDTGDLLVITSVIDNLIKGAAGQAVQNMNILCGFKETEAL